MYACMWCRIRRELSDPFPNAFKGWTKVQKRNSISYTKMLGYPTSQLNIKNYLLFWRQSIQQIEKKSQWLLSNTSVQLIYKLLETHNSGNSKSLREKNIQNNFVLSNKVQLRHKFSSLSSISIVHIMVFPSNDPIPFPHFRPF